MIGGNLVSLLLKPTLISDCQDKFTYPHHCVFFMLLLLATERYF